MRTIYENRLNLFGGRDLVSIHENKNFSYLVHWHNEIEIAWVVSGTMDMGLNKEVHRMTAGDLCICKSGDIHFYDSRNFESKVILIILRKDGMEGLYQWIEENPGIQRYMTQAQIVQVGLEKIYDFFVRMQEESIEERIGSQQLIKAYATEMSVAIMRHWPVNAVSKKIKEQHDTKSAIIQQVLSYVDENISQELSMKALATRYNVDLFYLSKLFNRIVGMPFKTYLNILRTIIAEEKLITTNSPMIDIALECGFNTVRNFNRVFKSIKKVTPSECRLDAARRSESYLHGHD